MELSNLPTINAGLNFLSALFLLNGYLQIKKGNRVAHQRSMVLALITSVLFLSCYLYYHFNAGSVPYPLHDWTRTLYFVILIPHVILAVVNLPFIIALVRFAFKGNFQKHKRLARIVWPSWMYVSVTGVLIYYMLYIYADASI